MGATVAPCIVYTTGDRRGDNRYDSRGDNRPVYTPYYEEKEPENNLGEKKMRK